MASSQQFTYSGSDGNSNNTSLAPFLTAIIVVLLFYGLIRFYNSFVLRPAYLKQALLEQGIHVKPYRLFSGDLVEIQSMEKQAQKFPIPSASDHHILFPYLFPFLDRQISELNSQGAGYGTYDNDCPITFWDVNIPFVVLTNPENVKCVMLSDVKHFCKPEVVSKVFQVLLGKTSLLISNGDVWQNHRNILRPAFFAHKLKEMVPAMVTGALGMVEAWSKNINKDGQPTELEVEKYIKEATADILARTSFGSSYIQGKSVFDKQVQILELVSRLGFKISVIPGYRNIPTVDNRKLNKLEKAVKDELAEIVESRRWQALQSKTDGHMTDLLGLMLTAGQEAHQGGHSVPLTTEQLIDECRTFFVVGQETVANLLAWTMVLLSLHPEWQEKAREEVLEICGKGEPKADHLDRMKIVQCFLNLFYMLSSYKLQKLMLHCVLALQVNMVLNETMRLYPPVPELARRMVLPNKGNFQLRDRTLPEGTGIVVSPLFFHRKKDLWGDDADKFNPERFCDGIAKACKHPFAFMPFGEGPRNCIGQRFAMTEARVLLTVILQRFHFSLSPNYRHAPMKDASMKPRYGVQVIVQPLL